MSTDSQQPTNEAAFEVFTQQDFLELGVNEVAYFKPATVDGKAVMAIHAANGDMIAATRSPDVAIALIKQNDLEPFAVH